MGFLIYVWLSDADITADEIMSRLTQLREAALEMGHLGKFVAEFFFRVAKGNVSFASYDYSLQSSVVGIS